MITRLRGILLEKQALSIVLDVGGVGYEVEVPLLSLEKLPALGSELVLYTHYVVREDAHALFGFCSLDERTLFRQIIKVNGVGPKLAMAILSHLSVDLFTKLIQEAEVTALTQIPGIGKKTAERLLIELRDKLKNPISFDCSSQNHASPFSGAIHEAVSALVALGYKPQEASLAINRIEKKGLSRDEMIRLALKATA